MARIGDGNLGDPVGWTREDVAAGRATCERCGRPLSHLVPGAAIRLVDAILPCDGCGIENRVALAPSRPRVAFRVRIPRELRDHINAGRPLPVEVLLDAGDWMRVKVRAEEVDAVARMGHLALPIDGKILKLPVLGGPEDPYP